MMKKRKMIKQRWVIISLVILVILVAIGILYLLQQDNIKAAANARRYTQEQLREQLEESRQSVETALNEQYPDLQVRDLTEEERAALREGTMSREELIAALLGPAKQEHGDHPDPTAPAETEPPASQTEPPVSQTEPPASETEPPAATAAPTPTPAPTETPAPEPSREEQYQEALAEIIAEVYVLREEFTAKLDGMFAAAKAEYRAMPKSERTKSKLLSWASGYAQRATELESECDRQMEALFVRMRKLISEYNGDQSIVDAVADQYLTEKSIQKSLYIQELEKRGIM